MPGTWDNNDAEQVWPFLGATPIAFGTNAGTANNLYYQQAGVSGVMPKETAGYASESAVVGIQDSYFNETVRTNELFVQRPVGYGTEATVAQSALSANNGSYFVPYTADPLPVPPSAPFVTSITETTIQVSFYDISNPSNLGFLYSVGYGTGSVTNDTVATQINPGLRIYSATITGLTANTSYYLQSIVKNSSGGSPAVSSVVGPFTTAPTGNNPPAPAPSVPSLLGSTNNSLTVSCSAQGIVSDTPPIITLLYGTTTSPATEFTPVFVPGLQQYVGTVPALAPGTQYYFKSKATNTHGNVTSEVSPPYSTASSGIPPSSAPTVPVVAGTPTTTSITVNFDVAGITGNPTPTYSILYGINNNPNTPQSANLVSGTTYQAVVSGLTPGTAYSFQSLSNNTGGTKTSAISAPISTASTGNAPTSPPTVPILVGVPTATAIEVSFSASGVGGNPPATISALYRVAGLADNPITAVLQADGLYHVLATGLTPSTGYYFTSVASNTFGSLKSNASGIITTAGPGSATVPTICLITFLLNNGGGWVIDTGYSPVFGNWSLDGPNAGQIQGPTKTYVINRIQTLQQSGVRVVISLVGAVASLPIMFASGGVPFAQSLAYAFFGGTQNPLNWSNSWNGLRFDGIDLDVESNTPLPSDLRTFVQAFRASASNPGSILVTCGGVQQPNIVTTNPGAVNANGPGAPYATPTAGLVTGYNGDNGDAIVNVSGMKAIKPDYIFSQVYNQGDGWYIGQSAFNRSCAMFGYMCLKAGVGTKFVIGVATSDGTPIFNNGDATALSTALTAINAIIVAETSFTTAVISDWCGGIGFWNSPTANSVASAVWSGGAGAVAGLPASVTMLYLNQNKVDPQWGPGTVPVPNTTPSPPTPLNQAPAVPVVSGTPTTTSITVTFSVAGITGTTPINYTLLYGTTSTPTTVFSPTIVGTTATSVLTGLTPSTTYYFRAVATNPAGSLQSAVSAGIPTASAGSGPSSAPTIPIASPDKPPTATFITVEFDTAGITGIPTPTYSIVYGTTTTPISTTNVGYSQITGTTRYLAVISALTPATAYYFKAVATNSVGSLMSAVSASISTTATPGPPPSAGNAGPILIYKSPPVAGESQVYVGADFSGVPGFPVAGSGFTYNISAGTSPSALGFYVTPTAITPPGNPPGGPGVYWNKYAPSPLLPPSQPFTYYFQANVLGGSRPNFTITNAGPISPAIPFT